MARLILQAWCFISTFRNLENSSTTIGRVTPDQPGRQQQADGSKIAGRYHTRIPDGNKFVLWASISRATNNVHQNQTPASFGIPSITG